MKKKEYIQPHIEIFILENSQPLLSASSNNYQVPVYWEGEEEKDGGGNFWED